MTKPKVKDGKNTIFYLEIETIEEINRNSGIMNMSKSSYIDFIIRREKINRNPVYRIKDIQVRKKELQIKIHELENEEKMAIDEAEKLHNWQETKRIKKPEAIKILQRKLMENQYDEAEEIAKTWSGITGISAIELLMEAKDKIDKSGI